MFRSITPAKGLVRLFAGIFVMAAGLLSGLSCRAETVTGAARVIDGDTLAVTPLDLEMTRGQLTLRLAGIDAPELAQRCLNRQGQPYACGQVARDKLAKLMKNKTVTCTWQSRGKYGRPLATCWITRRSKPVNLNRWMLQWGWALAYRTKTPHLLQAQTQAQIHHRGLWQAPHRKPWRWRKFHKQQRAKED